MGFRCGSFGQGTSWVFTSKLVKKPFLSALIGKIQYHNGRSSSSSPCFCSKRFCVSCHHVMCRSSLAEARVVTEFYCGESNLYSTCAFTLTYANIIKNICIWYRNVNVPRSRNCENKDREHLRGVLWKELELEYSGHSNLILNNIVCKGTCRHTASSWSPTAECESLSRWCKRLWWQVCFWQRSRSLGNSRFPKAMWR